MRNRFRYFAPQWGNVVTYAVALALGLAVLHGVGADLWAAVVAAWGVPLAFVGGGFLFYMGWFWAVAGAYMLADRRGWFERWRIQVRPAERPERRGPSLGAAVRVVLRNQVLGTLPGLALLYPLLVLRGVDPAGPPPGALVLLAQLAGMVLVEEVLFYTVHRAMHRPALFRRFHRVHHEFRETIGIATHYVHPVEHALGNLMPVFAGALVVGAHPVALLVWAALAVTNAIHTHAGFALPWMSWGVDHDFHHYNIRGCYGAIGLLDRMFGTDAPLRAIARTDAAADG